MAGIHTRTIHVHPVRGCWNCVSVIYQIASGLRDIRAAETVEGWHDWSPGHIDLCVSDSVGWSARQAGICECLSVRLRYTLLRGVPVKYPDADEIQPGPGVPAAESAPIEFRSILGGGTRLCLLRQTFVSVAIATPSADRALLISMEQASACK